jgi:nucleoid-associated protein YgaU
LDDAPASLAVPSVVPSAPAATAPIDHPAKMSVPPPSLVAAHTPLPVDVGTVRVAAGQTLLGICIQKYGACTSQLLQQIHDLNPSLNNPDHIESGQSIRIPVLAAESSVGEQPRGSSSAALSTHE